MNDFTVRGAQLIADFISPAREAELLACIDAAPWRTDLKRRVQHYGWRYDYRARRVAPDAKLGPVPDWLNEERMRLAADGFFDPRPDQIIVNEYEPGQGIAPHVDCVPCFGPVIASLTLAGFCEMQFQEQATGVVRRALLQPRSLLVLTGPARTDWTHAIAARKSDVIEGKRVARGRRVSLTYRTVIGYTSSPP